MIKKVYHIADVHIPTYRRMDMYATQLEKLTQMIAEDLKTSGFKSEEARIVICGDLVDSKNTVTNELNVFATAFIRELSNICKVLCIAGNHDLIESNTDRIDTVTALFQSAQFENASFIDMNLNYCSGVIIDENISWALYSIYEDFSKPKFAIEQSKKTNPDNKVIGLFHGTVVGSKIFNGFINDVGSESEIFEGCDAVMAGHIHMRQVIEGNDCQIVYPGSTIQKNYGESLSQHGFAVWNMENLTFTFVDVPSDYGYVDITINDMKDIEEDKEILNNF